MNLDLIQKYSPLLTAITVALAASKEALTDDQKAANEGVTSSIAASIREFAVQTATDGVKAEEGRGILQLVLTAADNKAGTVKAYGAAFAGFRSLIQQGKDVSKVNCKQAQDEVASADVKATKAAKDRIATAAKTGKWKSKQWAELADYADAMNPKVAEAAPEAATEEVKHAQAA